MTDIIDTIITALKAQTVFGSRVFRGWPPAAYIMPCCGVSETVAGNQSDGNTLAVWTVQVDSWGKTPTDIVAIKAAINTVARTYRAAALHRSIPETGSIHVISTFDIFGGS